MKEIILVVIVSSVAILLSCVRDAVQKYEVAAIREHDAWLAKQNITIEGSDQ